MYLYFTLVFTFLATFTFNPLHILNKIYTFTLPLSVFDTRYLQEMFSYCVSLCWCQKVKVTLTSTSHFLLRYLYFYPVLLSSPLYTTAWMLSLRCVQELEQLVDHLSRWWTKNELFQQSFNVLFVLYYIKQNIFWI